MNATSKSVPVVYVKVALNSVVFEKKHKNVKNDLEIIAQGHPGSPRMASLKSPKAHLGLPIGIANCLVFEKIRLLCSRFRRQTSK